MGYILVFQTKPNYPSPRHAPDHQGRWAFPINGLAEAIAILDAERSFRLLEQAAIMFCRMRYVVDPALVDNLDRYTIRLLARNSDGKIVAQDCDWPAWETKLRNSWGYYVDEAIGGLYPEREPAP